MINSSNIKFKSHFNQIGLNITLILVLFSSVFGLAFAEIEFEDVSDFAGISYEGRSWGSSWGDFNGDGLPDLWSNGHRNTPSLYLNNGNGTFSEIRLSIISNVKNLKDPHGAAWADFDNDGDQDIIILSGAEVGLGKRNNFLFVNQNGTLTDNAKDLGVDYPLGRGRTPIWFDYDLDGKLDLLIVNWPRPDGQAPTALFHQTDTRFVNVTNLSGTGFRFDITGAQISDLDRDGKMELVARTPGPQGVYDISELPFKNIQDKLKLPEISSIDLAISDFNGDLQPDIYFTQKSPGTSDLDDEEKKSRYAEKIFLNTNEGFKDITLQSGLGTQTSCRSVVAGDFDNDMDVDLYLVCTDPQGWNLPNVLYENQGKANFVAISDAGGAVGSQKGRGDSVTTVDYDSDGFLDLFITNGRGLSSQSDIGPSQLFRNLGNDNHWLEIDLLGTISNNDGIGSHLLIKTGDVTQLREQAGGMHTRSQNHQRIHVGLENNSIVDSIIIFWPSGIVHEIRNTSVDQILKIKEPSSPLSPKHQQALGLMALDVLCKQNMKLITKSSNGEAACVKQTTWNSLVDRGWGHGSES